MYLYIYQVDCFQCSSTNREFITMQSNENKINQFKTQLVFLVHIVLYMCFDYHI